MSGPNMGAGLSEFGYLLAAKANHCLEQPLHTEFGVEACHVQGCFEPVVSLIKVRVRG